MSTITTEQLVARRVAKGHREDESRQLLAELTTALQGDNLEHALVYEAFATERQAQAFTHPQAAA